MILLHRNIFYQQLYFTKSISIILKFFVYLFPMQVSVAGIIFVIMFISDLVVLFLIKIRKPLIPPSPYYNTAVMSSSSSSSSTPTTHSSNICLVSAIDYNQFTFFLLANLSTGLVNMSVDTIYTGPVMSLIILGGHLVFLSIISILLHKFKIKLV